MRKSLSRRNVNRKAAFTIIFLFLMSRLMIYLMNYFGFNLFPHYDAKPKYHYVNEGTWSSTTLVLPKQISHTTFPNAYYYVKFDTYSYLRIAENGYDSFRMNLPHPPANWVFDPLYPLSVRAAHELFRFLSYPLAGILLSNLFLLIALFILYQIFISRVKSPSKTISALFLLLVFPTSLYFSVPYTESLFLMLSALSVYKSDRGSFAAAFLFAGLSAITRPPGVVNIAYVLIAFLISRNWRLGIKDWRLSGYLALAGGPMLLFLLYMKYLTGDFMAPSHEEKLNWGRQFAIPFQNVVHYLNHPYFILPGGWDNGVITLLVFLLVSALYVFYGTSIIRTWSKNPNRNIFRNPPLAKEILLFGYGIILVVIPFSSTTIGLVSEVRYMMVSFPLYLYIVKLSRNRPYVYQTILLFFILLNAIYDIAYINNYYFVV